MSVKFSGGLIVWDMSRLTLLSEKQFWVLTLLTPKNDSQCMMFRLGIRGPPSQLHMLNPNAQCDYIWRRDFWDMIRSWEQNPYARISAFIIETPESYLFPSFMRTQWEKSRLWTRKWVLTRHNLPVLWSWILQVLDYKKLISVIYNSQSNILLQQPRWTTTHDKLLIIHSLCPSSLANQGLILWSYLYFILGGAGC